MPSSNELITAILSGLGIGGLFAVAALGLSLVFGVMRLINLAHGELIVLGAYLAYSLTQWIGIDPLVSILIVAPVVALIAYPLQRWGLTPVMSKGAEAPLLITFGVSVVLQNLFILAYTPDVRSLSASYSQANFSIGSITIPVIYVITLVAGIVLLYATHLVVTRTGFGRQLRAGSEDPAAAGMMGVNVKNMYAWTFAIAAGSAAIAGILVALAFSFAPSAGTAYLITGFAVVVLGGIGSIKGTLIGGLALGVIESIGATFVGDGWRVFIGCAVVLLVLTIRPQGLFGSVEGN